MSNNPKTGYINWWGAAGGGGDRINEFEVNAGAAGYGATIAGKTYVRFKTDGTGTNDERMRITSAGRVGIGTNNPDFSLQVNATNGGVLRVTRAAGSTTGVLGNVRFGNTDVDSNLVNVKGIQDGATDSAKLVFQTQATGGSTSDRMVINSTGAVQLLSLIHI